MPGQGLLSLLNITQQDSYAVHTTIATSAMQLPYISESLKHNIGQLLEQNMYSRFGESPTHEGAHSVDGSISLEPEPAGLGVLLKMACGQVVTTSDTTINTHVFRPLDVADFDDFGALPSFSVKTKRDAGGINGNVFHDCQVANFTLEAANGELLSANMDLLGRESELVTVAAGVFISEDPFTWDTASISYGGANVGNLKSLSLQLANNLELQYTMNNSKTPSSTRRTAGYNITGTLVLELTSAMYFNIFTGQTEQQLLINFTSKINSPAQLTIDIPKARIEKWGNPTAGPAQGEISISFRGKYDTTSSYALQFTLVNTQPTYWGDAA